MDHTPPLRPRTVRCPSCGQPAVYGPGNPSRPFCSARCRSIDLGAWAAEGYRVADRPTADPDAPDASDASGPPAWPH